MLRYTLINRRSVLRSAAVLALSGLATTRGGLIAPAWAQSARYHRISVGACEVTILSDGHMVVPTSMLAGNTPAADLTAFLAARALGPDRVHFHLNVASIRVAGEFILIDTGAGGTWEATAGLLPDSLQQAGIQPGQIGKIV